MSSDPPTACLARAIVLAILLLASGPGSCSAEDCFLRLTISETHSRTSVSANVSALGMTNIPMNYIGEEPMYMSGSLYLSFPSLGNTAGDCQLPSTSEEMMGALPDAYFLRPNGADPIKVWPSKFVLELFGTRNNVADVEIAISSDQASSSQASSNFPPVAVTLEHMSLSIRDSAFVDDMDNTVTDMTGELSRPPVGSVEPSEESGAVKMQMELPVSFLLESDPDGTMNVFMDMNVTAEVTLGCQSPCGVNGRCALDAAGQPVCECACGWKGLDCTDAEPCSAFRSDAAPPTVCPESPGASQPPAAAPPPVPAPAAAINGQCLATQMPVGWILPDGDEQDSECQVAGCECMPGFWGRGCSMCKNDEACQVYAARLGLSNAGNATCDTELEYRDEASQTRKNIFCFPKTPEVAAQVDDILVSCWINTTYKGEFTPPPGLLESIAAKERTPVDQEQNICFVSTAIKLGGQVGQTECVAYNCKLDKNGDTDCSEAICECTGSEEDCFIVNLILEDLQGATMLCSILPGDDCQMTLKGLPIAAFTASCEASQCIVQSEVKGNGIFVDGVIIEEDEEKDRSVPAALAYVVILLVVLLWIYIGCMLLLGRSRPKESKVHPQEPPSRSHCIRFEGVSVHVMKPLGPYDYFLYFFGFSTSSSSDEEANAAKPSSSNEKPWLRAILSDVSGELRSGTITALMGPSGSGKTTLLNVLMKRIPDLGTAHVQGLILLNGNSIPSWFPEAIGYVPQFETLIAGLTAREMVTYNAILRLPTHTSQAQIMEAVESTLSLLDISLVADNIVIPPPGSGARGVSGGEQKRVAVAMELVAKPQLLFLDEATSGLDSFLAESLMTSLREYSRQGKGRMVIATVHQPSAAIFNSLDQILCLSGGRLAYAGPPSQVVPFFESKGFAATNAGSAPELMIACVSNIRADGDWDPHAMHEEGVYSARSSFEASHVIAERPRKPWSRQIGVLASRTLSVTARSPVLVVLHWILGLVVGICMGFAYLQVQKDISGIQNRNGAIFFSLLFFGLASLTTVDSIFSERRAVRAEALGGHYNPALYIIVKGLVDALLLRIIPAILFLLPFYFLMGLNPISGRAAIFFGAIPTFSAAVGWLSLCVCTLASTPGKANLLIIVILLICMLFGGFVSNLKAMPEGISWLAYLSVFRYSFEALLTTELDGETIIPKLGDVELDIQLSGNAIIGQLGLDDDKLVLNIVMLNVLAIIFWVLGGVILWFKYRLLPSWKDIKESVPLPSVFELYFTGLYVALQQ